MKINKTVISLIGLLYLILNTVSAQKNNFDFYSIEDGLPHSSIFSVFQDSRYYLWLGSEGGGVSRFDGKKFYNYNKKNGLIGNTVRDIFEDENKNIWFATDEGITCYNGFDIISYGLEQGLSSETTFCLNEDNKGNILIGTAHGGLNILNVETDSIYAYTSFDGLNSDNVFATIVDSLDRIWLFYYGADPQVISFSNDSLVLENINTNFLDMSATFTGKIDSDGQIWIGTQNNGVYKITNYQDLQNLKIESFNILNGLSDNSVWNISVKGNRAMVSTSLGLDIISPKGIEHINRQTGLLSEKVLAAVIDSEENIWISMAENGLGKLKGYEFSHFSTKDGLFSNGISCIKQLPDSTFMISSIDNGISTYSVNSTQITKQRSFLENKKVSAFDIDSHNNLWVGTNEGLFLINENQTTVFNRSDNLVSNKINDVLVDSRDLIWMATSAGIAYFDGQEFNSITEEFDQLINGEVQTVIEDNERNLWFGTLGGLVKYDIENKGVYTDYNEEDGLEYTKIHSLLVDKYNNLWIGTYGDGLYYFDNSKDSIKIKHIDINDELLSTNIYGLAFINDSVLVVSSDKGFDKILLSSQSEIKQIKSYNKDRGFQYIENNQNAIYYSSINHCVYFGTTGGLSLYYPDKEIEKEISPLIHLSKIKLFSRDINWAENYKINRWNHTPISLDLEYTENHITFIFEGISLKDPEGMMFKYKLKGLSDSWIISSQNIVVYPSLPYGNYTFLVKAINSEGVESEQPLVYEFVINPPFYLTWWFITLSILFIILSIIIYIRLSLAKLKKDKRLLEKTVKERTAEIVSQKDIIEEKNRDITDSINYAQRIQKALLPSDKKLSTYFDEYFVLFRPKDIVSGDFYWANKLNNKILFTAADCTGHGVPGSIMSIIGNNGLENVVKNNTDVSASEVLEQHTDFVISTFKQSGEGNIKDGMDMALCVFDKENMILEFAGAHNPLYLVRKIEKGFDNFLTEDLMKLSNENYHLFEIKADKQPVGNFEFRKPFTNSVIQLQKDDTIYMFSDGYADQFGGPKGKKYKYKPFKRQILDIQEKPLVEQKQILENSIVNWMNFEGKEHEQIDDIIVFSVRF